MKNHSDKGRLLVAQAILMNEKTSSELCSVAIDCLLAYKENIMKNLYIYIKERKPNNDLVIYEYDESGEDFDKCTFYIKKNGKIQFTQLIDLINGVNNLLSGGDCKVFFPILNYKKETLTKNIVHKLVTSLLYNCEVVFKKYPTDDKN